MQHTSKSGFFSLSPLSKNVKDADIPEIREAQHLYGSTLGYYEPTPEKTRRMLELRDRHQTYEEWIVGGCIRPFDLPRKTAKWYQTEVGFEFEYFLAQSSHLGCLFYRGEMGEDIIFTRLFAGIDDSLDSWMSLLREQDDRSG